MPSSPAAVLPLLRLSIPTKQSRLLPTISELNVTTGIFFSTDRDSSFSLTDSQSTGITARPLIPSDSSSSIKRSCSFSSTVIPSFKISSIFFSLSSDAAFWIPLFTSSIKDDPASCVTTPILMGFPLEAVCLRLLGTYPISSAIRRILSET